ncbi:hypothetical protein ACVIVC_005327 [Sinorhizobium meliloti]|jgi:hypothetical protein|nr:hypothetical protein FB000_106171 [Ensifer sp. SEMIA 134]
MSFDIGSNAERAGWSGNQRVFPNLHSSNGTVSFAPDRISLVVIGEIVLMEIPLDPRKYIPDGSDDIDEPEMVPRSPLARWGIASFAEQCFMVVVVNKCPGNECVRSPFFVEVHFALTGLKRRYDVTTYVRNEPVFVVAIHHERSDHSERFKKI